MDETIEPGLLLLVEACGELIGSLDPAHVLSRILELSGALISADAYAVWRYDAAADEWHTVCDAGLSEEYVRAIRPRRPAGKIPKAPFIFEDVLNEPLLASRREICEAEGIRSLLSVVLTIRGENTGTIAFYYRQPHRFTELEVRLATALANLAGAAIGGCELYTAEQHLRGLAEQAQQRLVFLAEASAALAASLDYKTTLSTVARLAVPHVADWCAVDLMTPGGTIERLAVAHSDPKKVTLAEELHRHYPPRADAPVGVPQVIRTGQSEFLAEISEELLLAAARDEDHFRMIQSLGLRSAIIVPLRSRERILGAMTFVCAESGRIFTRDDLAVAEDLARRAASSIDNAHLFQEASTARAVAEDQKALALSQAEALQAANAELARERERLRLATEAADVGTWDYYPTTGVMEWSERCHAILGLPAELKATLEDLLTRIHLEDREEAHQAVRQALDPAGGGSFEAEFRIVRDDRSVRWIIAKGRALFEGAGAARQAVRFLGTLIDITGRKQAERDLAHQSRITRTITENATAALFMMDTHGRCTYMNPAADAMIGFTLDEIRDIPLHEAIHHHHPDGRPYPLWECPIDRALPERNQVRAHEDVFIRKDGTFFPVLCAAEPILHDDVPIGTVVEVRDTSAEKQAAEEREQLLCRAEEARAAVEAASRELREQHERQQIVTRYLRAANRAAAELTKLEHRDEMLTTVLNTLRSQFAATIAGVWLCEAGGKTLRLHASFGLDQAPTPSLEGEIDVATHPYKLGWVARYRRPFLSSDIQDDLQVDREWIRRESIRSTAIYPLLRQDDLQGVLAIFSQSELPAEVGEVLSTLAAILSSQLENAILRRR